MLRMVVTLSLSLVVSVSASAVKLLHDDGEDARETVIATHRAEREQGDEKAQTHRKLNLLRTNTASSSKLIGEEPVHQKKVEHVTDLAEHFKDKAAIKAKALL